MYMFLPGTCLSSILVVEPFKAKSFPMKTRVIWVQGVYIYIFFFNTHICIYIYIYIHILVTGFPPTYNTGISTKPRNQRWNLRSNVGLEWTNQTREPLRIQPNGRWRAQRFFPFFWLLAWERTWCHGGEHFEECLEGWRRGKTPTLFVFFWVKCLSLRLFLGAAVFGAVLKFRLFNLSNKVEKVFGVKMDRLHWRLDTNQKITLAKAKRSNSLLRPRKPAGLGYCLYKPLAFRGHILGSVNGVALPKTNMTNKNPPCEDAFPFEHGVFPWFSSVILVFMECTLT